MSKSFKSQYYIVFVPSPNAKCIINSKYKRFLISWNNIFHYVGQINALLVRSAALSMQSDKMVLYFRNVGKITVYLR